MTKKNYAVWIVSPENYIHSQCFEEVALGLQSALLELGYPCIITRRGELTGFDVVIVLGGHLLGSEWTHTDSSLIFYNLEQPETLNPVYLDRLKRHSVWDYSAINISFLEQLGIKAKCCEIGYMPVLTRIKNLSSEKMDVDVLFYGCLNERRLKIIQELRQQRIMAVAVYGNYGAERDLLVARSKIVLNMHYYESKIFEIVRCSYLMANRKCIVSEYGSDADIEREYHDSVAFTAYGGLIDKIKYLLANETVRCSYEEKAFDIFSRKSQAEIIKNIL